MAMGNPANAADDAKEAFAIAALMIGDDPKPGFTICLAAQPFLTRASRALRKAAKRKDNMGLLEDELYDSVLGVTPLTFTDVSDRIAVGLRYDRSPNPPRF